MGSASAMGGNKMRDHESVLDGHENQEIGPYDERAVIRAGTSVLSSVSSIGVSTVEMEVDIWDGYLGPRRMSYLPGLGEERRKREMNVQLVTL